MGRIARILQWTVLFGICAAVGVFASLAIADSPPTNGTNTSPFPVLTTWTNLRACVSLTGGRDKDRGSIRIVDVTSPQSNRADQDFDWN